MNVHVKHWKRNKTLAELAIKPNLFAKQAAQSIWFSSCTAALIASLEAVGATGKWVAVPPNVCPSVITAVFGAECKPWFVDIEPERQGMDPQRLSEVISQVAAVIAVHAYGVPCKINQIAEIARHAKVPLIEDCAQADGATYMGYAVGEFGDIAVFSFGTGKIVDAGGGGLAIIQTQWQDSIQDVIDEWPETVNHQAGDEMSGSYRSIYNNFYPEKSASAQESFFALVQKLAPMFKAKCDVRRIPHLVEQRSRRDALVCERRRKYKYYVNQFVEVKHLTLVPLLEGAAPWRFNALIDENQRDTVFRGLLADGIKASTWYPRISSFLPQQVYRSTTLPVSERFEKTLLNLWVDESISNEEIIRNCELLKHKLVQLHHE